MAWGPPRDGAVRPWPSSFAPRPPGCSGANAYAERGVRSVRAECMDWVLIWHRRHLERVLATYVDHCPRACPPRGLRLEVPAVTDEVSLRTGPIERVDVLGGLIHEYRRAA